MAAASTAGYFVSIPNLTNMTISTQSPKEGQAVTITDLGNGPHPETNSTVARRSVAIAGSPVSAPASGTMHNWCQINTCAGDQEYWQQVGTPKKLVNGQWVDVSNDASGAPSVNNGDTMQSRERILNVRSRAGNSVLSHSYYGDYSDVTLTGILAVTRDTAGNLMGTDLTPTGGTVHAIGALHGGTATSASDMSSLRTGNVTASYTGTFEGIRFTNGQNAFAAGDEYLDARGNISVNANFGTGTVSGSTGTLQTDPNTPKGLGYGVGFTNAPITGSTYAGNAYFTNGTSNTAAGSATTNGTSSVIGGFYGPGAAETAGSIRVQGTAPGTNGTTNILGSFGAKKQ